MAAEATSIRTDYCGSLTRADVGRRVRLGGWVHRRRDLGGLLFIDLRDREGLVQLALDPRWTPATALAAGQAAGPETVVLVEGEVTVRLEPGRDEAMASREIEVRVAELRPAVHREDNVGPLARR